MTRRKKPIYERNGVREYWLIDEKTRSVRQMVLTKGAFGEGQVLSGDDMLMSPALSGLRIPVADLFPEP